MLDFAIKVSADSAGVDDEDYMTSGFAQAVCIEILTLERMDRTGDRVTEVEAGGFPRLLVVGVPEDHGASVAQQLERIERDGLTVEFAKVKPVSGRFQIFRRIGQFRLAPFHELDVVAPVRFGSKCQRR